MKYTPETLLDVVDELDHTIDLLCCVQTCMDEYISKQKAERLLHIEYAYAAEQLLDEIPAADVSPVVHGRWNVIEGRRLDNAICSNCGRRFQAYYGAYSFCPNCGAKMDGGDTDEAD